MTEDPWTDPDPQPGDFDAELASLDPRYVKHHKGNPDAELRILGSVGREDASGSAKIALARRRKPSAVVAELIRDAPDRPVR